jgi:hypothetical protein
MRTFIRLAIVSSLALGPVLATTVPSHACDIEVWSVCADYPIEVCKDRHDVEIYWPVAVCADYPLLGHDH